MTEARRAEIEDVLHKMDMLDMPTDDAYRAILLRFTQAIEARVWREIHEKLYEYPSHDELVGWCEAQARAVEGEP